MKMLFALLTVISLILVACAEANEPAELAENALAPIPAPMDTPMPASTPVPATKTISSLDEGSIQVDNPPAGYRTYVLPFAYGLHYPADWFIQWSDYGRQIFSSNYRMDWKPVLTIPDEGALFFIMEYTSDYDDPMEIMEKEQIPNLDAATEILDDPQAITINGQPAASMVYRYYESGIGVSGPAVVERTIVTNGIHTIESMAITWEEQVENFAPIFQNIVSSLVLTEDRLEPAIGGSEIPADFEPYSSEKLGLSLAVPPDWSLEETGDGIELSPIESSATSTDFESFVVAASDPSANLYDISKSDDLGSVIVDWYFAGIVGEFFPVGEYVSGSPSGQMAARAYYGGMSGDEPVLAIVNYTYQDGTLIRSVGMMPIGTDHRAIIESIMDSIVISNPVHIADASAEALEIGQLFEGSWSGGSPASVTVDGVAGIPHLLMIELVGSEEFTLDSVTIYDPQGDTIVISWVFSDEPIPTLFEPDEDGIHLIEIGGGIPGWPPEWFPDEGQFTIELLDIDLGPNSDNLILNQSGQLSGIKGVETEFVATAGDQYLVVIRPSGLAAQTAFLSVEVTNENGTTVAENENFDLPGLEMILPFEVCLDGTINLVVSAGQEQVVDYELYMIQDERIDALDLADCLDLLEWRVEDGALWGGNSNLSEAWGIFEVSDGSTLSFDTMYDIEEGWDFGFVQVSTDGGATWTSLSNTFTASEHDPEAHFQIVANLPGLTGKSDGWITMSYDLPAGDVLVAFRYITDWGTENDGWYIDNVMVDRNPIVDGSSTHPLKGLNEVLSSN